MGASDSGCSQVTRAAIGAVIGAGLLGAVGALLSKQNRGAKGAIAGTLGALVGAGVGYVTCSAEGGAQPSALEPLPGLTLPGGLTSLLEGAKTTASSPVTSDGVTTIGSGISSLISGMMKTSGEGTRNTAGPATTKVGSQTSPSLVSGLMSRVSASPVTSMLSKAPVSIVGGPAPAPTTSRQTSTSISLPTMSPTRPSPSPTPSPGPTLSKAF